MTPTDSTDAYEALMQFLYRAPIGLAQTTLNGDIEMINPMTANLLMPLSRDGNLDNLFTALGSVAPQLRDLVAAFEPATGVVCESLRFALGADRRMGAAEPGAQGAPQFLSISLLKVDGGRLMVALNDATLDAHREQLGLASRLDAASRVDSLTQMPSRAVLRERLQQMMARASHADGDEFAVLFLNCDRFKQINDSLGHEAGDQLLGLIADRLRSALRQHDRTGRAAGGETLAARIGGDEFAVVLGDLREPDDVHAVAQRLLDVLAQPYGIGARQLHFSLSMGIVLRAQATGDADAVLQDASIAMVEAKRAGGARYVVFEPSMQSRAARRGEIEAELYRGLDEGQLFVVYQPVVGLQRSRGNSPADDYIDRSAGVEALVRWRHPTRGVVPPIEFIGVAEECGLIGAIGDFVLATACRQFVQWQHDLGARAPRLLAVNLSRAQLAQPGWVGAVDTILKGIGMPPRQLQLEVTESLAAQDETVQASLHGLKALGLTLALDDFGTGYSSLASLHLLPVDTVKIDRSFVSQSDTSHHHRVLIKATVQVAESLGMGTVAEGIETEAQAAAVRALGCDKGQGYLFSKPLPADEVSAWLMADSTRPESAAVELVSPPTCRP